MIAYSYSLATEISRQVESDGRMVGQPTGTLGRIVIDDREQIASLDNTARSLLQISGEIATGIALTDLCLPSDRGRLAKFLLFAPSSATFRFGRRPDHVRWIELFTRPATLGERTRSVLLRPTDASAVAGEPCDGLLPPVPGARRPMGHVEFLAEASKILIGSLDYATTLCSLVDLAVPYLADWCCVDVIMDGQQFSPIASTHVDPLKVHLTRDLQRAYPFHLHDAFNHVLETGRSLVHSDVNDEGLRASLPDAQHYELVKTLGFDSVMLLPLVARGRTIGVMLFVFSESGRRYSQEHLVLAQELVQRASAAVDHAQLYHQAKQAERDLQEANQAKDRFLALLSHELRNPLGVIQMAVDVLHRCADDPERVRQTVRILDANVALQTRLVGDLLELSRVAYGKVEIVAKPIRIDQLVARVAEQCRTTAIEAGLSLTVDRFPTLWVSGDQLRLEQVLLNLIQNAIKFTPKGGKITVILVPTGDAVQIVVEDTGIGIESNTAGHLFEMFRQGSQIGVGKPGLGVGLALVKQIVALHHGKVWAENNQPGPGSRFVVELPATLCVEPAVQECPDAAKRTPMRVLVVDDNPHQLQILTEALRLHGWTTEATASGEEALRRLATDRAFDAMICDLGLPGLDGRAVIKQVRLLPGLENLPAIALSGFGEEKDMQASAEAGFNVHLVKPINLVTLIETVCSCAVAQ